MWNNSAHLSPDILSEKAKRKSTREGFGDGILLAGEADNNRVVLTADLAEATKVG